MRRRKLPPDTRLDWRDPDMPIIRKVTLQDGTEEVREIASKYIEQYYANKISNYHYWNEGNWRDDPSYNWAEECKLKSKQRMSE